MPEQTIEAFVQRLTQAEQELRQLLVAAQGTGKLDQLTVSDSTDKLVKFRQRYQARLTAGKAIGNSDELRKELIIDLKEHLNSVLGVIDEITEARPASVAELNLTRADMRYEQRMDTAEFLGERTARVLRSQVPKSDQPNTTWSPLASLKSKPLEEYLRIILRTLPVDPVLDSQISDLLLAVAQGAEAELQNTKLHPEAQGKQLLYEALLQLVNSQEYREAIGGTAAPCFKTLIERDGELEAYDPLFRDLYRSTLAIVSRVHQSQGQPTTPPSAAPQVTSTPAAPTPLPPAPTQVTPSPEVTPGAVNTTKAGEDASWEALTNPTAPPPAPAAPESTAQPVPITVTPPTPPPRKVTGLDAQ